MQADGTIKELILLDGRPAAWIRCPPGLIPAPGQYLLAHADGSEAALAAAVFAANTSSEGFLTALPVPADWTPGRGLHLRGPLGRGFAVPAYARRIALIAVNDSPRRLLALLDPAFKQDASVTLVCEHTLDDLPLEVEVQPVRALADACHWADYVALDCARESLPVLKDLLGTETGSMVARAQVLVRVPMPCGGLAECGVCSVKVRGGYQLACEYGPVFDLNDLI